MHRFILRLKKGDGVQTDHWNCNGLDNQRRNLRRASHAQNQANQRKQNGRSSRFKGVYWNKERQKWQAQIEVGDDRYNLGRYKGEKDAARAYNAAARRYFGRFAKLNSL